MEPPGGPDTSVSAGGSFARVVETALTDPSRLSAGVLEEVLGAAHPADAAAWGPALAAIIYARGDLADPVLVDRLVGLLRAPGVSESVEDLAATALEALASTGLAGAVARGVIRVLAADRRTAAAPRLVTLLRACVCWCPEHLDVGTIVELASRPVLGGLGNQVLGEIVEPLVARAPAMVTESMLERILTMFGDCPRLPYTLQLIGARHATLPVVRRRITALTAGAFPVRDAAEAALTRGSFALLAVLNVRVGQGDEIVWLVALLQALLEANPALTCTVVTSRVYLYDHPRVHTVSISNGAAVGAALALPYDGVIHVSEPGWPETAWQPALDGQIQALVARRAPALVVTARVGFSHFIYRSVTLAGREIADSRSLNRRDMDNIYDGSQRLLAELGLPARVAEERPTAPDLLTGTPSTDADRVWERLSDSRARPVALVSPYGGAEREKGYIPDRPDLLAEELAGLVAEGYRVVLVPNGTPWGTREAAAHARDRLPPTVRDHVVIAPDPAEEDPTRHRYLTERPDLPHADRVMRLFKYFVARADLVVTVEGWMGHVAYALGRPVRLVLRARSFSYDWHPSDRGPGQRLATALSPHCARAAADVLGADDPAPLPSLVQKPLFRAALAGLARLEPDRAIPILMRALASPDHDVRGAAVGVLARFLPADPPRRRIIGALLDPEPRVRRVAAEALLDGGVDCREELGPGFRDQLLAHGHIGRQDWPAALSLGAAALPALFAAVGGASGPIHRESRRALVWLLGQLGVLGRTPLPNATGPDRAAASEGGHGPA